MSHADRTHARAFWAVIACALTLAWTVHAQDAGKTLRVAPADQLPASHPSTPGVGWALLVGVGAYENVEGYTVSRLSAPAKDVDALRTFLTDPKLGAFPASNVRTLIDEQATKAEILLALANMRRRAAPEDLVLFYFSGHGYRPHDEGDGGSPAYLLPYVTNPLALNNPDIGCIKYEDITEIVAPRGGLLPAELLARVWRYLAFEICRQLREADDGVVVEVRRPLESLYEELREDAAVRFLPGQLGLVRREQQGVASGLLPLVPESAVDASRYETRSPRLHAPGVAGVE